MTLDTLPTEPAVLPVRPVPTWRAATLVMLLAGAVAGLVFQVSKASDTRPRFTPSSAAAVASTTRQWDTSTYPHVYYASPSGLPTNTGTDTRPLDLATALSASSPVGPGDLLWLREGRYAGNYLSVLAGSADAFIVVAEYPGEHAVLDGETASDRPVLRVEGAYTIYWGFEVTNSAPDRPGQSKASGVEIFGSYTKFINMVVHHTGNGMGVWRPALSTELYGNLIFDSGWDENDRGHGHSIYIQNALPTKWIVDNILFDSHSFGVHAYTEGGNIDHLHFEGNIAFGHGARSSVSEAKANFLIGGRRLATHTVLRSNIGYYPWTSPGRNADLGYITGCDDAQVERNYFAGGVPLVVTRCTNIDVKSNHFAGQGNAAIVSRFPQNTYVTERPTQSRVFVRPNRYVAGRAHVAIFNWAREPRVSLDVTGLGLTPGEPFEVRDVREYFGTPLAAATYDGRPVDLTLRQPPGEPGDGLPPEFVAALVVPRGRLGPGVLPWTRSVAAVRQDSGSHRSSAPGSATP